MGKEVQLEQPSRCPVQHSVPSTKASSCPFGFGKKQMAVDPSIDGAAQPAAEVQAQAACPYGFGRRADVDEKDDASTPKGGRCPFGYDSQSAQPKLSHLHCVLCKGLFFDCVAVFPCGDRFCRACISHFSDCPVCGRDVEELHSDATYQGVVDAFIEKHSKAPTQLEATVQASQVQDGTNAAEVRMDNSPGPAAFFLDISLQSLAGGNFPAALQRLGRCRDQLLNLAADHGLSADLSTKLGAVCGSQGDCSQRMGDFAAAASHFEESVQHLQQCLQPSDEVLQALSVSFNKLGDLQYWNNDVTAARAFYERGLVVRQQLLAALSRASADQGGEAHTACMVDVAVSLGKLMDADRALGNEYSAAELHRQAIQLAERVGPKIGDCSAIVHSKFEAVQSLLHPASA